MKELSRLRFLWRPSKAKAPQSLAPRDLGSKVLLLYMPLTCMMAFLDRTFFDPNHRHKDDEIRLLQVGCFIFFLISLLCLGYFLSKRFLELSWVLAAQALLAAVNAWALLSWAAFSVRSLLVEEIRSLGRDLE